MPTDEQIRENPERYDELRRELDDELRQEIEDYILSDVEVLEYCACHPTAYELVGLMADLASEHYEICEAVDDIKNEYHDDIVRWLIEIE